MKATARTKAMQTAPRRPKNSPKTRKKRADSVLFVEQSGNLRGGQTVLLSMVEAALRHFDGGVGVALPTHGSLKEILKRRFGDRVALHFIAEPTLPSGTKRPRDVLAWLLYSGCRADLWRAMRHYSRWHINGPRLWLASAIFARLLGRQFDVHLHLCYRRPELWLLRQLCKIRVVGGVYCASHYVFSDLERRCPKVANRARSTVVENGVDATIMKLGFTPTMGDANNDLVTAVVGRIAPEKGHELVIEVALRLPDYRFVFIGGTDDGERGFAAQLRDAAPTNVEFVGEVQDVPAALARHGVQVSVVPSRWHEPFGLVAVESMLSSCVTVARPVGGLADIAKHTGMLLFDTCEDLVGELRNIAAMKKSERRDIAAEQFERTRSRYSFQRFANDLAIAAHWPNTKSA